MLVDASVVGRVFWRGALTEIAQRDDLSPVLGSLEARDLVQREAVSRIRGDQQFGFKHGLIHEVAYGTLPRAARRKRHAAVARFLEASTAVGQSHEALGHHWSEAGEADRAVEHLTAAGDQAGRGWAKQRAVALYREALELVAGGDPQRRDVTRRLAVAMQAVFHLPDAERLRRRRRGLDRIVDEREVVGRHVAGDLVDRRDDVVTERVRVLAHHLLVRRVVDAERLRRSVRADDDVAVLPDDLRDSGSGRSPSTASRRSEALSMSTVYVRSIRYRGMARSYRADRASESASESPIFGARLPIFA